MKTTIYPEVEVHKDTIFVFGSNTDGIHGAGSAYSALVRWGAKLHQARGLQGSSYAIVTKDLKLGARSIPLEDIQQEVNILGEYIRNNPQKTFLITAIGQGLAGYTHEEISPMFDEIAKCENVKFFNNWR